MNTITKTSITYYFTEDRQLSVENRNEHVGLLMTKSCMTNSLHSLLLKSGWKNTSANDVSVYNSAKAQTYIDGKLVMEVKLKSIK